MRYRLTRFFSQQLDAIGDAIVPLLLAVVLTAVVVWLLARWRYRRALARLEGNGAGQTTHVPLPSFETYTGEVELEESRGDGRARRKALRAMTNAVDGAELALRSGNRDQVESALPNMWLALATARSTFELPIPAQGDDPRVNLSTGKQWLEHVRPALRAGDDDEARRRSVAFLNDKGLQQA